MTNYDLDTMKKDLTPRARPYLQKERGMSDTQLKAMCDGQAVALFILGRYQDARDDVYKAWYLPYLQSEPLTARAETILRTHKNAEPPLALMCASFLRFRKSDARRSRSRAGSPCSAPSKRSACTRPPTGGRCPGHSVRSRTCLFRVIPRRGSPSDIVRMATPSC